MKKIISILLAMALLCGCALAEIVYVTISDGDGKLVMARQAIDVSDEDADGTLTINDALIAAHNLEFEGGAAAGFITEKTEYGLSIYALWGVENGGSYSYYLNNGFAGSLWEPIAAGDRVNAYCFSDLATWSDTYSFFDTDEIIGSADFELTLFAQVYDADWNLVQIPVADAIITINGVDTEFVTDAEGKVTVHIEEAGEYVISARSQSMVLVPPVCIAMIGA